MPIVKPKDLIACRKFFLEPSGPKQRQYEAIRAYYLDELSGEQAATKFGYTHGSFRQLLHAFVNDADPQFFITPKHGPQAQPKKDPARETIIALRKQNYSVSEISEALREAGIMLSAMAVDEVLKVRGFCSPSRRSLERALTDRIPIWRRFRMFARSGFQRASNSILPLRRFVPVSYPILFA